MKVITVRNIPDALYRVLVRSAERNRRSLQQQVLTILERARLIDDADPPIERALRMRARLAGRALGDTVAEVRRERRR